MSDTLFSSQGDLEHLAKLLRGYLRLPFADGLLPGRFVETVIARIKGGTVCRPTTSRTSSSLRRGWDGR